MLRKSIGATLAALALAVCIVFNAGSGGALNQSSPSGEWEEPVIKYFGPLPY